MRRVAVDRGPNLFPVGVTKFSAKSALAEGRKAKCSRAGRSAVFENQTQAFFQYGAQGRAFTFGQLLGAFQKIVRDVDGCLHYGLPIYYAMGDKGILFPAHFQWDYGQLPLDGLRPRAVLTVPEHRELVGPLGLEPRTKGFTLPRRFRREWTISSPMKGAGRSSLSLSATAALR